MESKSFYYESVRAVYFDYCEKYFLDADNITGPWTKEAKMDIIKCIKNKRPLKTLKYNLRSYLNKLNACEIALEDGSETLVVAGSAREYLSFEECFDVFVDLHLKTDHGNFNVMRAELIKNFVINGACLNLFLSSCNHCKSKAAFNDIVLLEILKAPIPDGSFNYLLVYADRATEFKLFKPLISIDEYEMAVELLKIFTDYGPPVCINSRHTELLTNVLSLLSQGGLNFDISLNCNSLIVSSKIVIPSIPNSSNWSIKSRIEQYVLNNCVDKKRNAFGKVFQNYQKSKLFPDAVNKIISDKDSVCIIDETNPLCETNLGTERPKEGQLDNTMDEDVVFFNEIRKDLIPELDSSPMETTESSIIDSTSGDELLDEHDDTDNISIEIEDSLDIDIKLEEELSPELNINTQVLIDSENNSNVDKINKDESIDCSSSTIMESKYRYCSECKGKMLTDFTCFRCKKYTHIFCLILKTERNVDKYPVKGYTICKLCLRQEQ